MQGTHNYGSIDICVQETPPPPANDECTGAIPVSLTLPGTLCVSSIFANTSGATLSANSPSCVSINFNNDDTWYSFTAPSGTAILRYSNCFETTTTAGAGLGYALYNSCPSGNASLLCSNNFGFINGFTTLTGLTAGNVYLPRLFGSNSNNYVSFNFCIQSPLQNDECINAITLPVTNGFCTSPVIASLNGATTSAGFTSPTCRIGGPTSDVWFKTSAVKTAGNDLVMTAYTGASGTLTQIACDDDGNPETFPSASHSRITLTGRTTGETIMLRVTAVTSANEEQFAICAWDETTSVLPLITAGGNCITGNAKIIDSAQGNIYMWVPIFDNSGNIIAEVYSNGNDLGLITPNLFVNSGAVRQFGSRFYLDRNMAIQSANSITNPIKLRLYLKQTELSALQAVDPSVSGITQLKITKTNTLCQSAYSGSPTVISQEANSNYGVNYYLQYSTNGFSSFYLDGLSGVLPLKFIQFTVLRIQTGVSINWTVVKDSSIYSFEVEKSENGIQFHTIASAKRDEFISERNGNWNYTITDALANNIVFYYRIKLIDINGRIIYSKVKKLNAAKKENLFLSVYPNPANKGITIEFNNISNETAIISIFDISGRKLKQFQQINLNGKIILNISDFKAGIYLMKIDIGGRTYQKKFIK